MVDKDNGEFLAVHEEVVKKVLETLPDEEELYDLAELFKVFGDSTRIRILHALFESELCVGDIAQILNLSQSAVSHQLKLLKDAKLVRFRRLIGFMKRSSASTAPLHGMRMSSKCRPVVGSSRI